MAFDVTGLTLIGKGHHGKVYRLDNKRCVKVYRKKAFLEMEYGVLKHSERLPYFPKVFECGENYMIREYIEGPNLLEYIKSYGFSKRIAIQLLELLDSFSELGYSKLDIHLHHIIVAKGTNFKIIDPTTNMSRKSTYPRRLLEQLDELGVKEQFLAYTKLYRPKHYEKWCNP